jgi:hypothetical protein
VSGPIVRKYGFPNFEQIFGKRELEHGADEDEKEEERGAETNAPGATAPAQEAGKPGATPPLKSS